MLGKRQLMRPSVLTEGNERSTQARVDREMSREGWSGLQRREGAAVLGWLDREERLGKGFDALAMGLREILNAHVRSASDAREVWEAASAVMAKCNDAETYSVRGADAAYGWLHLLDRYVRTWLALERLLAHGLLPMGKHGVRVLDVGTGPGPSAFATHDFYNALTGYAASVDGVRWQQPSAVTCVERSGAMNHFRHVLSEILAVHGAPQSILAMASGLSDFATVRPSVERRDLERRLRDQYEDYYDDELDEWYDEPTHTAEEANREANAHRRYRLFTFSNFLTTLDTVSTFQGNLEDLLTDAQPGATLLMIGGKGNEYPEIHKRMSRLAEAGGFRRSNPPVDVGVGDVRLDGRLAEEARWFHGRLKGLAGDLLAYDAVTRHLLDELEGRKRMDFRSSAVHAFRK